MTVPPPNPETGLQEPAGNVPVPAGVVIRKSRQSYGIAKFVDFVDGYHDPLDRWEMESVNRVVAINQMKW